MGPVWNCYLKDGPMIWKEPTHGPLVVPIHGSGDTIVLLGHQTALQVVQRLCIHTTEITQRTWVVHIGLLHQ